MWPPAERLIPDDSSGHKIELGLVVQFQRASRNCLTQVTLQHEVFMRRPVHSSVKKTLRPFPIAFARYMARSALRSNSSAVPVNGHSARYRYLRKQRRVARLWKSALVKLVRDGWRTSRRSWRPQLVPEESRTRALLHVSESIRVCMKTAFSPAIEACCVTVGYTLCTPIDHEDEVVHPHPMISFFRTP